MFYDLRSTLYDSLAMDLLNNLTLELELSVYYFAAAVFMLLARVVVRPKLNRDFLIAELLTLGGLVYFFFSYNEKLLGRLGYESIVVITLVVLSWLSIVLLKGQVKERENIASELLSIFFFALGGMVFLLTTSNIIEFFIAVELVSMALYVLMAFNRTESYSLEGVTKYLIQNGVFSALLLLGLVMYYMVTGNPEFTRYSDDSHYFKMSLFLIVSALMFKLGASPLHFWLPDAYTGARAAVTAFMSTTLKLVVFAFMVSRLSFLFVDDFICRIVYIFSIFSMIIGTLLALRQTNVKRLLAYSSVANAGYILVGFIKGVDEFVIYYYVVVYTVMTLGAFASVAALERGSLASLDYFSGLGRKRPLFAANLSVLLLSLAGVPITGGFVAKFYVAGSALEQNIYTPVVILLLTTAVSFYYYLRIIIYMFMKEPSDNIDFNMEKGPGFVMAVCSMLVIALGILPFVVQLKF